MKIKLISLIFLSFAFLLNACLFDSDSEEEEKTKSSSSTEVVISSSSKGDVNSSSSQKASSSSSENKNSSSSTGNSSSSSSNLVESSSSQWVDYPYYSSGIFCFTEGCEDLVSSSSSEPISSSSSVTSSSSVIISSSSSIPQGDGVIEDGVMVDKRDNQRYEIMTVNDKTWMAENISFETPSGSYCYQDNETNCDVYGRLYTHAAALLACPGGWHMSTRSEYEKAMEDPDSFIWIYNGRMKDNSYDFLDKMGFNWVSGSAQDGDESNCDGSECQLIFVQKNPETENSEKLLFFQKDQKTKGFGVRCVKN